MKNLSYVNESISTVHADHIGVKTFKHDVVYSIEEAEFGLDQACRLMNVFTAECEEDTESCQFVNENMEVNERAVKKIIQVWNTFERLCTLEEFPSSKIIIARCR